MDFLALGVALILTASAAADALRYGADGPNWKLRWESLPPTDLARLVAAARSHAKLDDFEEAELAAGFKRHERRRSARIELAAAPFVLLAATLALTGTLSYGTFGLIAYLGLAFGLYIVPRVVKRREPLAQ